MKRLGAILILAGALTGCDSSSTTDALSGRRSDESTGMREHPSVAVYAAVVRQLVTVDHTFGEGTSPFRRIYIIGGVVEGAAQARVRRRGPDRPFTADVKKGMLRALADLPEVEFVANPARVLDERGGCTRVRSGGALISLGPISRRPDGKATVPTGLFFACLGGQWLTYVLERTDSGWRIVGTTGPVAIA